MARDGDDESPRNDRRRMLSGLGAPSLAGLAGCSGGGDGSSPTAHGGTTTDSGTTSASKTTTATTALTTAGSAPSPATFSEIDLLGDVRTHAGVALTLSKDGSGDFETVGTAIDEAPSQVPDGAIIRISPETYKEKLNISPLKPCNSADASSEAPRSSDYCWAGASFSGLNSFSRRTSF